MYSYYHDNLVDFMLTLILNGFFNKVILTKAGWKGRRLVVNTNFWCPETGKKAETNGASWDTYVHRRRERLRSIDVQTVRVSCLSWWKSVEGDGNVIIEKYFSNTIYNSSTVTLVINMRLM